MCLSIFQHILSGSKPMRYAQLREFDVANGPGIRSTVFVTGCTFACPGCFNGAYQDFKYGELWTPEVTVKLAKWLRNPFVSGLTVLGGEPMQQGKDLAAILKLLRNLVAESDAENSGRQLNIWIFSGYKIEQLLQNPVQLSILEQCDTLVDGLFQMAQKDLMLRFRGSANQRILDIKKSLASLREGNLPVWQKNFGPSCEPILAKYKEFVPPAIEQ